jgi:uncharacterized protein with HEPN domain
MKATKRDHRVYLEDILTAIERIEKYSRGGAEEFFSDTMLQDAIIRQVSIVGEAAAKLPKSVREQAPDIPWKQMIGMRNIVIHDYSEIKLERIWETIETDLPVLRQAVTAVLWNMAKAA